MPIPMKRGRPARVDYEYERNGTANLFMLFAPLEGWRHIEVTDRHTAIDYAHVLKDLADRHFPHVKTIVLVQDNLNIHSKASLYEAFPASEARRLVERFEWHYTPKHGSWLDLAESELGVLSTQCLDRRIPDQQTLIEEIAAWENDRNAHHTKADWGYPKDHTLWRLAVSQSPTGLFRGTLMKGIFAALVATVTLAATAVTSLGADTVRVTGPIVVSAAANLRPAYITSPDPGYIVYADYAAALPDPNCYWTRMPLYDLDRNVIGWRGRPVAVCPQSGEKL